MRWMIGIMLWGAVVHPARAQVPVEEEVPVEEVSVPHTSLSQQLLQQGRRQIMQLRFDEAEHSFQQLQNRADGKALGQFYVTSLPLLRALLQDQDELLDTFFEQSDELKAVLSNLPAGRWRQHLEAEMHMQRAIAHAKRGRYLKAIWAARSAYKGYQEALEETTDFYEPQKGIGLFHLVLGTLPRSYRRFAQWAGYEGSVPEGLRALRLAADSSRLHQVEAQVVLAFVHVGMEGAPRKGLRHIMKLHRQYPHSPLVAYLRGLMLRETRQVAEAASYFRSAREAMDRAGRIRIPFVGFYLADCAFRQNKFRAAALQFQSFLKGYEGNVLAAEANLRLGMALEMQGRRPVAEAFYRRAQKQAEETGFFTVERRAGYLLERRMTKRERQMLRGRNWYDAGSNERAEAALRPLFEAGSAPQEVRTEAAHRLGLVYQAEERYEAALRCHRYAVRHRVNPKAKWAPWSQYNIAVIDQKLGRKDAARRAFEAVMEFEGPFDYYKGLEQRVRFHLALL